MDRKGWLKRAGAIALGLGLALAPAAASAAERGGRAERSSHSGRSTATRSTASRPSTSRATGTATRPPRSGKQTASGRATYGHGRVTIGGWYPWWGHGGYYGWNDPYWGWDVWWGWGWPYRWSGWYGYPGWGPYPYRDDVQDIGPAAIEVDVSPRKSKVVLDGEDVGLAKDYDGRWDRLPVGSGTHVVELSHPGYQTLRVVVDARSGGQYRIDYDLTRGDGLDPRSDALPSANPPPPRPRPEPRADVRPDDERPSTIAKGFLKLEVAPPDAAVYLDGDFFARGSEVARLRGAIPLAEGEHRLEVVRPGFRSKTLAVTIAAGETERVAVALDRD